MISPVNLLPTAISELFAQATRSGKITLADRYGLMAAILADNLDEEERNAIDRLLRSLRRGRLQVVDELSAMV